MRTHVLLLAASLSCLTVARPSVANAHITQTFPATRTSAQKQGPCGETGSVRGAEQVFEPGETITVTWDETVEHPGHYRIAFDVDGENFPLPNTPDDDFEVTLVDQIPDRNVNGNDRGYSQEITFPDIECENCTLQLIQIMTTNIPYNSFYFQCSDIALRSAGGGGGELGADAGSGNGGAAPASGSCSAAGGPIGYFWGVLVMLAAALVRRRPYRIDQ